MTPNKPKTPTVSVRVKPELWKAAVKKAAGRGETVSDVVRARLEEYVREDDPAAVTIDECPACNRAVEAVEINPGGDPIARPCGHRVAVTMWPRRVQLDRVEDE